MALQARLSTSGPRVSLKVVLLAALAFLGLIGPVVGTCCNRKGNFGCCGNGACNIFCCNCDGGCNAACEGNTCDIATWSKCAGVVTACSAACALGASLCAQCMGALYDTCKGCYGQQRRRSAESDGWTEVSQTCGGAHDDHIKKRDEFFNLVSKNKDQINLDAFTDYVKKVAEDEKAGDILGPARKIVEHEEGEVMGIAHAFMEHDANKDGFIDRREFGF